MLTRMFQCATMFVKVFGNVKQVTGICPLWILEGAERLAIISVFDFGGGQ